jgi:hypothetical protein
MTRPELLELYRKTTFVYRAQMPWPRFVVLTADAPTGEHWPPKRTRRARRELERLLSGRPHRSVTGCDPGGSHAEKGWAFPCPDDEALAAARALGCRLRQFALFHVQDGRLELVWCAEPDERHDLGAWAARRIPRR